MDKTILKIIVELAGRMIKEQMFITLQFYPDTPIGFYKVYGTSLEEVVRKAKECLVDTKESPNKLGDWDH